jgi:isocitrate dehydrogenase (NAD+)
MLHHIGESDAADKLQAAIERVYTERKTLTRDVGGSAGTRAFADAVIQALETSQQSASSR